ncbi:hypothetical protein K239x_51550 [Planctomycetes bacterium K23_9]|uniref:Uncharacterized protein n=1 Tax=Stieleria marina TaxID=1930275 RepID=A0A517P190_9BACT|nr:hypothetical protein K239x_51550 [Planctomycetes bacterium K23_9]
MTADEYTEIAVQLLYDLPSLRAMQHMIDERFRSSLLVDPIGLARDLESHFASWAR